MKTIRNKVLSILFLLTMAGSILLYDLYITPKLLTDKVIVIQDELLTKNSVITETSIKIENYERAKIPKQAIAAENADDLIGKKVNVDVTKKQVLTYPMVDIDEFIPNESEAIFAINSSDVYAINGSLRAKDKVDIYLVDVKKKEDQFYDVNPEVQISTNHEPILTNVLVVHVRADDNNDVYDSEQGNTTNRTTSTSKVAYPEMKIDKIQGQQLMKYIEEGYKLWIVRVQ